MSSNRPLSPHLQVYKPQLTSVLSITHRLTGLFLCVGVVGTVLLLWGIAYQPDLYNSIASFMENVFGHVLTVGLVFSLFYHLANGIRHLFWDVGKGFELKQVYASGWAVVGLSVLFTLAFLIKIWS